MSRKFTGRQTTVIVGGICAAVMALPVAALAASGTFSSSTASTPALSATNSAAGFSAKAVYGNAASSTGTVFGVYGHTNSARGYGVYSSGRLGSSGPLLCSHCVSGADVDATTLPTVPDASHLAGQPAGYYARFIPLSWVGIPQDGVENGLADAGGVIVYASCRTVDNSNLVTLSAAADSDADAGTLNVFTVRSELADSRPSTTGPATAFGAPLSAVPLTIAKSLGPQQVEGSAIYRNNADGQIVTMNFHVYGANCEAFGDVITPA